MSDIGSIEKIMLEWERKIYGFIYRMVQNREDAADLTQEVFIKVYKQLNKARLTTLKAWLYTIATNTVYDFFRKKRSMKESFIISDPDGHFETSDPFDAYTPIEERRDVEHALATIKPEYRTVLLLFYRDELSLNEISVALERPVNTVKTLVRRGREAVRDELVGGQTAGKLEK